MISCIVIIDLHCDPTIPSGAGDLAGGNTYSRDLLLQLMKTEYKHIFITRKKYSYLDEYIKLSDTSEFYRIDLGDFGPIDKDELQKYHDVSMRKIRTILSKYSGVRFIFHSSYWQSGLIARELSEEFGTFYVHTILSNAKKKKVLNANADNVPGRIEAEEQVFEGAKYLICSSISEMNDMQALYNIDYSKLLLAGLPIHHSYSNPAYTPSGAVAVNNMQHPAIKPQYLAYPQPEVSTENYLWWNQKSYVYMGRMHENKGIKQILMAWIQLAEEIGEYVPPLWIIGGAPAIVEVFRNTLLPDIPLLKKYELRHKIIWWGALPPQGISTLLLKALAVVTHSKYEAGGLVAIEAMRQGIPVLGTPHGYVNDYVRNWHNGFVINFNDINALSKRLRFFYNQPYLSDVMGRNAHKIAVELEKTWGFFECHLFAYGLMERNNSEIYSLNDEICAYYRINHNPINAYPYINDISSTQIKDFVQNIMNIDSFTIKKNDCTSDDYESWSILSENKKIRLLYLYDIIREDEIWNPSPSPSYMLTKEQRVINYITASTAGLCSHVIYHSTKHGLIALDENTDVEDDLKAIIFKMQNLKPYTKMCLNEYNLSDECQILYSNLKADVSYSEKIRTLSQALNNLIKRIPCTPKEYYIGIAHGKHSENIFAKNKTSLPCDKIILSDQGEIEAFVIYNYSKKHLLDVDDVINELELHGEIIASVRNWCEYFRIYDEAEQYFACL